MYTQKQIEVISKFQQPTEVSMFQKVTMFVKTLGNNLLIRMGGIDVPSGQDRLER